MDNELKNKLIGSQIKAIDSHFDSKTGEYAEEEIIVKILSFDDEDTIAIVEKTVKYSQELLPGCGIKLEFTFPEKLTLDVKTNRIKSRLMTENTKIYSQLLNKAYKELVSKTKLYYIYRHYGPIGKTHFTSSLLIGIITDLSQAKEVMNKDMEVYKKEGNEFDNRPQKFTYSISSGLVHYLDPSQTPIK